MPKGKKHKGPTKQAAGGGGKQHQASKDGGGDKDKPWLRSESDERRTGCNIPGSKGCVVGEPIPAGATKLPEGAVQMTCDSGNCPAVPYVHEECFRLLEDELVKLIKMKKRSWTEQFARLNLWKHQGQDLQFIRKECRCPHPGCTGYFTYDEQAANTEHAMEQALKNAQQPARPAADKAEKATGGKKLPAGPSAGAVKTSNVSHLYKHATNSSNYVQCIKTAPVTHNEEQWHKKQTEKKPKPQASSSSCAAQSLPVGAAGWHQQQYGTTDEVANGPAPVPAAVVSKQPVPQQPSHYVPSANVQNIVYNDPGLTKERIDFVKSLERTVASLGGEICEGERDVTDLMSRLGVTLNTEICEYGGLRQWLDIVAPSANVHCIGDTVTLKVSAPRPVHQLPAGRVTGVVAKMLSAREGQVHMIDAQYTSEPVAFYTGAENELMQPADTADTTPLTMPLNVQAACALESSTAPLHVSQRANVPAGDSADCHYTGARAFRPMLVADAPDAAAVAENASVQCPLRALLVKRPPTPPTFNEPYGSAQTQHHHTAAYSMGASDSMVGMGHGRRPLTALPPPPSPPVFVTSATRVPIGNATATATGGPPSTLVASSTLRPRGRGRTTASMFPPPQQSNF